MLIIIYSAYEYVFSDIEVLIFHMVSYVLVILEKDCCIAFTTLTGGVIVLNNLFWTLEKREI